MLSFKAGQRIRHVDRKGRSKKGTVAHVHMDDVGGKPYYTVAFDDGSERSTESSNLAPITNLPTCDDNLSDDGSTFSSTVSLQQREPYKLMPSRRAPKMKGRTRVPCDGDLSDDDVNLISGSSRRASVQDPRAPRTRGNAHEQLASTPNTSPSLGEKDSGVSSHNGTGSIAAIPQQGQGSVDAQLTKPKWACLPYMGLCLAIMPHVVYGIAQTQTVDLNDWVLTPPKIAAPFLLFVGLAYHHPPLLNECSISLKSIRFFACGILLLIVAGLPSNAMSPISNDVLVQLSLSASELVAVCDSVASKAILITNAVLLALGHIGPWAAFENIAFLGPLVVISCAFGSAFWTHGMDIYLPHDTSIGSTLLVQMSWLLVAFASQPSRRPQTCAWVYSIMGGPI